MNISYTVTAAARIMAKLAGRPIKARPSSMPKAVESRQYKARAKAKRAKAERKRQRRFS